VSYGKAGIRKDSWSHWQDETLAKVVLEYEAKGKTQQEAFEVAGAMIGKSAAACQGRWHTELKHKHWAYEPNQPIPIKQEETKQDNINHPPHYTIGGIEVIDYIRAKLTPEEFIGFCRGNVLKYVSRAPHKGGVEDLKKAKNYLDFWIETAEGMGGK